MNQGVSKFNPKPSSKSVSKFSTPSHSSLKRKRPDEPFQRYVLPKLTPSYDLQNKKLSTATTPLKTSTPNTPAPVYRSKTSVQSKTTLLTPSQTNRKDVPRISMTAKNTVEKFPINPSRNLGMMNIEKSPRESMIGFTPIKKSLRSKDFEELVCLPKKFENEKDNLLSNLNNLVEELSEKHNPLLEETNEKYYSLEAEYEKQRKQQKEALTEINNKIDNFRYTKSTMKFTLNEKIETRFGVEQQRQSVDFDKSKVSETINRTKSHLNELLKKNENLDSWILNIQEAMKKGRANVRARHLETSQENKNVQMLKELVQQRKENIESSSMK